jgi:tol-pal system protein YbgF
MQVMRPLLAGLLLLAGGIAVALPAAPALAQDANLSRELERLRRDLNDLQRYVYKGGKTQAGAAAGAGQPAAGSAVVSRMQLQITQMQTQVRTINGRVEEVQHGLSLLEKRLDRMADDLELRLRNIEDGIAAGAAPAAPAPTAASGESGGGAASSGSQTGGGSRTASIVGYPKDGSPRDQYDFAFDLLKKRDYASAAKALQAFLKANPDDPLSGNALYWLGETRYVQKDYKDAARIFLDGFKRYPKGAKAPDNLLKLGMSLGALNEAESACKTYAKLLSTFPKAASRIRKAATTERKKLECG